MKNITITGLVTKNVNYFTARVSYEGPSPGYFPISFNCSLSSSTYPQYNWYTCHIQLYPGKNKVELYARSFSGCWEDMKTLNLIYDYTSPTIIISPQAGTLERWRVCSAYKVEGSIYDIQLSDVSLYINGKKQPVSYKKKPGVENAYEFASNPYPFNIGRNEIRVEATDCAGNKASQTVIWIFKDYWGYVSSSSDRISEYKRFAVAYVDPKDPCVHDTLWNLVMSKNIPLKEKIFALSYLFGDITGMKIITGKEPWYNDVSLGIILLTAFSVDPPDLYLEDKALWTLVHMEGSSVAAKVITHFLQDGDDYIYWTLRRHALGSNSKWLGRILKDAGFYMSPEIMERRAREILSGLDISAIPFDELIEVIEGDYPIEKKEGALDVIVDALLQNDPSTLSDEEREKIGRFLFDLKEEETFKDKAILGLGFLGGYEDYLLKELKYGEEKSVLIDAIGERGNVETAKSLIKIMIDPSFERWRRIMAGRIAFTIIEREAPDSEIMDELKNYAIPFLKSVLFDSEEEIRTRYDSLELISLLAKPDEYSSILKDLLISTDDFTLLTEGLSFAKVVADCSSLNDITSISTGWSEELDAVWKHIEKIEKLTSDAMLKIVRKLVGGEICNKKKCRYEVGIVGKIDEAISKIDEAINKIPPDMNEILNEVYLLRMEFDELHQMISGRDESIEVYAEKLDFIKSHIKDIIDVIKGMKEVKEKIKEVEEKVKEMEEKLHEIKEVNEELEKDVKDILRESGYESYSDLKNRENELRNFIIASNEAIKGIKERCNPEDPPETESIQTQGNPGKQRVMGYIYDPDGDKLKGVKIIFLFPDLVRAGESISDSYGVYGARYKYGKGIVFLELPTKISFSIRIVIPPYYRPYLLHKKHGVFIPRERLTLKSFQTDMMIPFKGMYLYIPFINFYFPLSLDHKAEKYLSKRHRPLYYLGANSTCKGINDWKTHESYYIRSAKKFYLSSRGMYSFIYNESINVSYGVVGI